MEQWSQEGCGLPLPSPSPHPSCDHCSIWGHDPPSLALSRTYTLQSLSVWTVACFCLFLHFVVKDLGFEMKQLQWRFKCQHSAFSSRESSKGLGDKNVLVTLKKVIIFKQGFKSMYRHQQALCIMPGEPLSGLHCRHLPFPGLFWGNFAFSVKKIGLKSGDWLVQWHRVL